MNFTHEIPYGPELLAFSNLLDTNNDWKNVAADYKLSTDEIGRISDEGSKEGNSPTRYMLERMNSKNCTVKELGQLLGGRFLLRPLEILWTVIKKKAEV